MNVFILICLIGIIFLGFVVERSKWLSCAIIGIFLILTCFSYDSYDYHVYTMAYDMIGVGGQGQFEPLFNFFMLLGNKIGLNYLQYRMVISVICVLLIHSTVRKFTDRTALVWAMFIVFPGWTLTTLLRHMMALSVAIFGLRYLFTDKKGNTIKLLICLVIAASIHNSFWVFLPLILVKFVRSKWILLISICVVGLAYIFGSTNLLFKIFEVLPTQEDYMDRYMVDSYSNLNGIIYGVLKQIVIMFSGYAAVYLYRKRENHEPAVPNQQSSFVNKVFAVNNVSVLFLGVLYYTKIANRMYHLIVLANWIACAVCLGRYKRSDAHHLIIKWGGITICLLLSVLLCARESPVVFDNVLRMHFETNDLINMFN